MSLWAWKAPLYSSLRSLPPFKNFLEAEKTNLTRLLPLLETAPMRHLDIGSGTGDSLALFHASEQLVCSDASGAMLRRLTAPNPKLIAYAEALPFAEATFDFVSAIGVLEYVQEEARFFHEAHRVLQPQGYFLFTSAPPVPANYLRTLWGERLYLRNAAEVRAALSVTRWRMVAHARTFLQEQWLAQRV